MMKRTILIFIVALTLVSCGNSSSSKKQATTQSKEIDVTEVLYFHGKRRCVTCNNIETLTKQVVEKLANKKIVMKIIDISKSENKEMANRYEISWSSLILNKGGKTDNLTGLGFKYAKTQPEHFKSKLKDAINKFSK